MFKPGPARPLEVGCLNLLFDSFPFDTHAADTVDLPFTAIARRRPPVITGSRADLRNVTLELITAILAVALCPTSESEWLSLQLNPPDEGQLERALAPFAPAFDLSRFLQDHDDTLLGQVREQDQLQPSALLFDSPGEKTTLENRDFFTPRVPEPNVLSWRVAVIALYLAQTYAMQGGSGHRVGVRGGGPITTLVLPKPSATIYETALANLPIQWRKVERSDYQKIFPWMAPTRTSTPSDRLLKADDVHPLQALFGMPRRIRCRYEAGAGRVCAVSGRTDDIVLAGWVQRKHGVSYGFDLRHPFSPYNHSEKPRGDEEDLPTPVRTEAGGVGWQDVYGLVLPGGSRVPAEVVRQFRRLVRQADMQVLAFGYATPGNKVRGFVEGILSFPLIGSPERRLEYEDVMGRMLQAATMVRSALRAAVWTALVENDGAKRQRIVYDKSSILTTERRYWERVGARFRQVVADQVTGPGWNTAWHGHLRRTALRIYDEMISPSMPSISVQSPGRGWTTKAGANRDLLLMTLSGFSTRFGDGEALFRNLGLQAPQRAAA